MVWDVLVKKADGKFHRHATKHLRRLARDEMFRLVREKVVSYDDVCVIRRTFTRETASVSL